MRTIDDIIDDIVSCADEMDGGKVDAQRYARELCEVVASGVRRLADEQARASARQWQPIETAPKDGTEILLRGASWTRTGYWAKRTMHWCVDTAVSLSMPTHWMPLPFPPRQS